MTIHVYAAKRQPATRYLVDLGRVRTWIRCPERRPMFARCCKRMRIARNLLVQVYYDGVYASCKPGKGCKENRR